MPLPAVFVNYSAIGLGGSGANKMTGGPHRRRDPLGSGARFIKRVCAKFVIN